MRLLPAIFGGLLAATTTLQAAEIAPGVAVDDRGSTVFLTSPERRLEARDVATGALRWSSAEAVRPLAAAAGRVLAQADAPAGRLDLVLLDAASGRRIAAEALALPEGVTAPIDEVLGTRFDVRVEQAGPEARIDWRWEQRPVRGALLEDDDADVRRAEGAVVVHLAAARFTAAPPRAVPQGPPPLPASLDAEAAAGSFRERPLRIGARLVATRENPDGSLQLKRWSDTGAPLPDMPLPAGVTLQMGSADGAHVLVSAPAGGRAPDRAHAWTVVSLATGLAVAAFRAPTGAAPFVVAAGRVLVVEPPLGYRAADGWREEPRRIEAFDTRADRVVWTQPMRNFAYRGPVAP
jgi:hypothetical protein